MAGAGAVRQKERNDLHPGFLQGKDEYSRMNRQEWRMVQPRPPLPNRLSFPAASGGPVSLAREKPGKERGRGVPLHPGAQGAEAKGT